MSIKANGIIPVHHTKKLPRKITGRRRLDARDFVFPEERRFPIPDAYHATLALSSLMRVAGRHGVTSESRSRARAVLEAVKERYPKVFAGERDLVDEIRRTYDSTYGKDTVSTGNGRLADLLRRYG
jgi:hypothetical protein